MDLKESVEAYRLFRDEVRKLLPDCDSIDLLVIAMMVNEEVKL